MVVVTPHRDELDRFSAAVGDPPWFLRGNVQPYPILLSPTLKKETRVANIFFGNYCKPKCVESWVEVKFEDEKQGKIQEVASPDKPNATIGDPEKVIASLGSLVTGNSYDPNELLEISIEKVGD